MRNSSRRLAVATTIALAVSSLGGVALASEAADATQPVALEAQAEEMVADEAPTEVTAQPTADEAKAEETTTEQTEAAGEEGSAEEKDGDTATDDVTHDSKGVEYSERIYNRDTKTTENKVVDEADIEWVLLDGSRYPSEDYRFEDVDGFRYWTSASRWNDDDSLVGYLLGRARIGETGELLVPNLPDHTTLEVSTDHTWSNWYGKNEPGKTYTNNAYLERYIDADVPEDVFTPEVDKYGRTAYYYPGGEYGPEGYYYIVAEGYPGPVRGERYIGKYWCYFAEGDDPFSGTSSASEGTVAASQQAAANIAYTSPTVEATKSDTAAAKATPETGDPTSLAGAASAAVAALGALVSAKALRRK